MMELKRGGCPGWPLLTTLLTTLLVMLVTAPAAAVLPAPEPALVTTLVTTGTLVVLTVAEPGADTMAAEWTNALTVTLYLSRELCIKIVRRKIC